jgi:OOP family OmpA-OmpF porin
MRITLVFVVALLMFGPAAAQTPPSAPAARTRPPAAEDRVYRLFFDWDDARVSGQGLDLLDQAADDYRRNGRAAVEIVTGTDESGPLAYNQRLSARRARAVAAGLVRRGIPRRAIRLRPMGERRQLVATSSGIREPMNRYAEISFPAPTLR